MEKLTTSSALQALSCVDEPYKELFKHGSLSVEVYKPEKVDPQEPHDQDEVYVVISGSGIFVNGESRKPFEMGEVLFVPTGAVHRFEEFTDDFATWVIFYGPVGGEIA